MFYGFVFYGGAGVDDGWEVCGGFLGDLVGVVGVGMEMVF